MEEIGKMAVMTLKRSITQQDLDPHHLELEAFLDEFNDNRLGPFSAKVNFRDGVIFVGGFPEGWRLVHDPACDWYSLQQDGGHPV